MGYGHLHRWGMTMMTIPFLGKHLHPGHWRRCVFRGFSLKPCGWGPKSSLTFWGDVFQITLVPLSLSWSSSIFVYRILCRSDINGLSWPSKQLPISADPSLIFLLPTSRSLHVATEIYWNSLLMSSWESFMLCQVFFLHFWSRLLRLLVPAMKNFCKGIATKRWDTFKSAQLHKVHDLCQIEKTREPSRIVGSAQH
jgi:hypothetical protein